MPLIELKGVGKSYGNIIALKDINLRVGAGQVTGVLGDNGAGKSTLIKIIAGLHKPTEGELLVDGEPMTFDSPKDALANGIATVYQDLAVVALMPVWRNFFLGQELRKGPLKSLDTNAMRATTISRVAQDGHRPARRRRPHRLVCRVVSASAWRSRARCSSAPGC